jgi:hydrogenase maturation protease
MLTDSSNRPLIIGLGNEYRGDDCLGITVIEQMRQTLPDLGQYIVETSDPTRLIYRWSGRDVILIDAVQSLQDEPGKILIADSCQALLSQDEILFSSHALGLREVFQLSCLTEQKPNSFYFIGAVGKQWGIGTTLSEKLRQTIPKIIDKIKIRTEYIKSQDLHSHGS